MHWTRIALLASAAVAAIGTCLPWLKNVPPKVLTIGEGTIYGITTAHGIIAAVCAAGVIAMVLVLGERAHRLSRGAGAGLIALAVVAIAIGSLVLGTSHTELLEETEKQTLEATGDQHKANLAVIAMAKLLDEHPMDPGAGMEPFALGWAGIALLAIVGMFLPAGRKPEQHGATGPPPTEYA